MPTPPVRIQRQIEAIRRWSEETALAPRDRIRMAYAQLEVALWSCEAFGLRPTFDSVAMFLGHDAEWVFRTLQDRTSGGSWEASQPRPGARPGSCLDPGLMRPTRAGAGAGSGSGSGSGSGARMAINDNGIGALRTLRPEDSDWLRPAPCQPGAEESPASPASPARQAGLQVPRARTGTGPAPCTHSLPGLQDRTGAPKAWPMPSIGKFLRQLRTRG